MLTQTARLALAREWLERLLTQLLLSLVERLAEASQAWRKKYASW